VYEEKSASPICYRAFCNYRNCSGIQVCERCTIAAKDVPWPGKSQITNLKSQKNKNQINAKSITLLLIQRFPE
jgi:hypothetical protein